MLVSRLQLDHPALGTTGGTALHTAIETIYQKIGDNSADRYFVIENLADTASADCDHNFNTLIGNLRYDLYLLNMGTGEITFLTEATTPARSDFNIIAKVGDEKNQLTVTNNSGSEYDLALVVLNDPIDVGELRDVDLTGVADGLALVYESATEKFKPGYASPAGNVFEFTATGQLTGVTTAYPCTAITSVPRGIQAVQKFTEGWRGVDNIGNLCWVTDDANKYLQGDIDSLVPSAGNPVRIFVE